MPAPETSFRYSDMRPTLGHVNLMVDTFIANASADEYIYPLKSYEPLADLVYSLRSIVRNLLATGPPGTAAAFTSAARSRLRQTNSRSLPSPYQLFRQDASDGLALPLPHLHDTLTRARTLYGAGLGFGSLKILASIVRATIGLRWEDEGDMADILAVIDADIGQAIQSSKEEIEANRVVDLSSAREARDTLRRAVQESMVDVNAWGGEFPFERASASLEYWKF